jgi:hypothetical protein
MKCLFQCPGMSVHVPLSRNTMTKLHTCGPSQCVKLNFDTNVIPHHFTHTHTSRQPFINTRYVIITITIIIIISVSDESRSAADVTPAYCSISQLNSQALNPVTWSDPDPDPRHSLHNTSCT